MRRWTIAVLAAASAAFLLSGCQAVTAYEQGVVEPNVDKAYDEIVKRWCRMPVDIQVRAIERKTITPRSLTDNCPEWRSIRDAMIGEAVSGRTGLLDNLTLQPDSRIAPETE